jgi:hypothetical protein
MFCLVVNDEYCWLDGFAMDYLSSFMAGILPAFFVMVAENWLATPSQFSATITVCLGGGMAHGVATASRHGGFLAWQSRISFRTTRTTTVCVGGGRFQIIRGHCFQ